MSGRTAPLRGREVWAGTGHRPPRLGLTDSPADRARLAGWLAPRLEALAAAHGEPREVWSGMALGFDLALAEAALSLGWAVRPVVVSGRWAARWAPADKAAAWAVIERGLEPVVVRGKGPLDYLARDRVLVEGADRVVALYDGNPGVPSGAGYTVAYAVRRRVPVVDLWEAWVGHAGVRACG